MVSKAQSKFIKSLQVKKYRLQEQSFVVEGAKSVQELLKSSFKVRWVAATPGFISENRALLKNADAIEEASPEELERMGGFQTNDQALALADMKPPQAPQFQENELVLALDDIRDPGNFGAIIRTADWFGIRHVLASTESADVYSPKVLHASMGSFTRVNVYYLDLKPYFQEYKGRVFGAFLDGRDVHDIQGVQGGAILIGNESRGISSELAPFVQERITIKRYGQAESLNAALATAIICDNFKRAMEP